MKRVVGVSYDKCYQWSLDRRLGSPAKKQELLNHPDGPPAMTKLSEANDSVACGWALGNDDFPSGVLRTGEATFLLNHIHKLLLHFWKKGSVTQSMNDTMITTLYINIWACSECKI